MAEGLEKPAHSLQEKPGEHPGILRPAEAARNFQLSRFLPTPELAPFVEHHWLIRWDLRGQPPYVSEVLPHPSINVAFTVERGWITGVTTGMYTYTLEGVGLIVGVMFKPGAFYAFRPQPVSALTDQVIGVTEAFPEAGMAFREALLAHPDDAERVATVEALLTARRPRVDRHLALITTLLEAVAADRDLRTVEGVAERFHLSARTVQQLFQKYVGVGLKWVLMRYRLLEAAELAAQNPAPNWAAVAAELGYSDQAHFVNDFRKIVGKTPARYTQLIHSPESA